MPRTNVPVQQLSRTGLVTGSTGSEVTGDSANNHSFINDGKTFLHVRNSAATATRNVTLVIAQPGPDGATVTNPSVAVPISSEKVIGPFPQAIYNQPDGTCYINVDNAELRLQAIQAGT